MDKKPSYLDEDRGDRTSNVQFGVDPARIECFQILQSDDSDRETE